MLTPTKSRKQMRDEWLKKIQNAEKKYADYYDLIKEIRSYYRNERHKNKQNIFWSSIETLKPFLYFKQPEPFIIRNNKTANAVEATAAKIMERALTWNLQQFDFDSVIKYARNDFLLSGLGVLWEQYNPSFYYIGKEMIKNHEQVDTIYVSPLNFLSDTDNVNVWEDVTWVARKAYFNMENIARDFSPEIADYLGSHYSANSAFTVYEIWDKTSRQIYYLCLEYPLDFLSVYEDTLHLSGFFPCAKPIMSTLTNDGIIPVPDYVEIKSLLDELDGVNNRMRLTMQALKVSGCYDNSFPELANILDKDVTLISIADFDKLKDAGGLKGIIDFAPIEQYVTALATLAQRRETIISAIYEVTGVSDIMRGSSQPKETATAVEKKTNFGTLRNQDRQNEMQRFLKDLLNIKAEIICEQFSPEFLASFLTVEEKQNMEVVTKAVRLLKNDKLRTMSIDLETDGCFNREENEQRTLLVLKEINEMINCAFSLVSQQPALLPLYRQMIESAVANIPNARQFDIVMETAFNAINKELNTPDIPPSKGTEEIINLQKQKADQDYAIKKEQNEIKREELNLKKVQTLSDISSNQK